MAYVTSNGLGDVPAADPAAVATLARIRQNYDSLRAQLVADAQRLTAPPSFTQRALAWASGENLDTNASAGQSLLNAVRRFDSTLAAVMAGDYDRAADLQNNLNTAVKMWSPDNDPRPWKDLANAIIEDLKALPRNVAKAAGALVKDAGAGLLAGLGPVGTVLLVAGLAGAGYVAWRMSPAGMLSKRK